MEDTNAQLSPGTAVQLSLLAKTGAEYLAAPMLAEVLRISLATARKKLELAPSVLVDGVDVATGTRLHRILLSLGLQVAIGNDKGMPARLNLSIQPRYRSVPASVVAEVSQILGEAPEGLVQAFAQPGGRVLTGLSHENAVRLQRSLRRVNGLTVAVSDPKVAVFDLYQKGTIAPAELQPVVTHLLRLGLRADPLTGALAAGLSEKICRHVLHRFPDGRIFSFDRVFQRFDVVLTGMTGWITSDLADFLVSRTALPRARFEALSPARPLCIERGLTYEAARQFHADYESIGVHTRLRLACPAVAASA
jgi:hypothetical protein